MPDSLSTPSFSNIHFPQRIALIKNLRLVSFVMNDIVLFFSCVIFFVWMTNFPGLKVLLFEKLSIAPMSSLLFIFTGASLLFGAKRHLEKKDDMREKIYPWWNTVVPICFATLAAILGLMGFFRLQLMGGEVSIPSLGALCFFLLGLSLIPPFTRIPHRFHIAQLLIFVVSGISMLVVLENLYQLFSLGSVEQSISLPLSLALTFAFFCFGILLRWSNRGFFGNFTLDATGSMFALRIFLINLVSVPLIILFVVIAFNNNLSHSYHMLSIITVLITFISSSLIWINVKLLYKYELEHLLMRETLRAHNIDLEKDEELLQEQMKQIEEERQQYKEKLTVQNGWQDAIDAST